MIKKQLAIFSVCTAVFVAGTTYRQTSFAQAATAGQSIEIFIAGSTIAHDANVSMSRATNPDDPGYIAGTTTMSRPLPKTTFSMAAQRNEGVISIVTRACGNPSNWRSVAADNGINPPIYLVKLDQMLTIDCHSTTTPVAIPETPSPAPAAPAYAPAASGWVNPLPGACIVSGYHTSARPDHNGLDLPAASGTPIVAAAAGEVSTAWQAGGAGNYTVINHGNGVWTVYMHQSAFQVTSGWVEAGQTIGYVGSTGNSSGPHLHFEVHTESLWNHRINPEPWMADHGLGWGWC